MSETKHTPGPWHIGSKHPGLLIRIWTEEDEGVLICHVFDIENAPVISAAPELLAKLKDLNDRIHQFIIMQGELTPGGLAVLREWRNEITHLTKNL